MKKILFGVTILLSLILAGCSENTSSNETKELETTISSLREENQSLKELLAADSPSSEEVTESSEPEPISYDPVPINTEVKFGDGTKETGNIKIIEVTTKQSAFPDYMVSLDDYDTTKMIAVKIEYNNVAMDEPFLPYASDFQAYGKDGSPLNQVSQQSGQDSVPVGRKGVTQLFWELPVSGNEFDRVEIDYVPYEKIATFDLEVSH